MIHADTGKESDRFIEFAEYALGILAREDYSSFIALFNSSRLTECDVILALKYMDETRPALKIDAPARIKSDAQRVYLTAYNDGSGYHMDYDLTTDGEINDLTIQIEFLKEKSGYTVVLDDLHTL